jgi:hypothetical protein
MKCIIILLLFLFPVCFCDGWLDYLGIGNSVALQIANEAESRVSERRSIVEDCPGDTYKSMKIKCVEMHNNKDLTIKFASLLAICHLEYTRNTTNDYICTAQMSGVECSSKFSTQDMYVFDLYFLHVRDVCFVAEQEYFKNELFKLVNSLHEESKAAGNCSGCQL